MSKTIQDLFKTERENWIDNCRKSARDLLETKMNITINDVLKENPRPKYIHPNATGTIFKHEDFKLIGYTKSTAKLANRRAVGVWRLADR